MQERRLVSVLFADLVGFTTLAESRDPETREPGYDVNEVVEVISSHYVEAHQAAPNAPMHPVTGVRRVGSGR